MKRKTNKKSGIIAAVVGLSAVSLVSVGFASWVISDGDTTDISGTIDVDTVTDNRFLIGNVSIAYGNAQRKDVRGNNATKIVYGIDDTDTSIEDPWLTAGSDTTEYENLDATLTFDVTNAPTSSNISVTFAPSTTGATAWGNAVTAELVAAPTITLVSIEDGGNKTIQDVTTACKTVTYSIHFNWGDAFDGHNPYVYYNSSDYSVSLSNTAKTNLTNLRTYLHNVSFVLTITTTA